MKIIVSFILSTILLCSCKTAEPLKLRATSAEIMKLSEVRDIWAAVQNASGANKQAIDLLKLNFSSENDLLRFARSEEVHYSFEANLCDASGRQSARLFILPTLRVGNLSIDGAASNPLKDLQTLREKDNSIVYTLFVPISGDELTRLLDGVSIADRVPFFDIQKSNENICLQLSAARMWTGELTKSNVAMFSHAKISGK